MTTLRRKDAGGRQGVKQDRKNLVTNECARCGYGYRPEEMVYRNGLLLCTIAGDYKKFPCDDLDGVSEAVSRMPADMESGNATDFADLGLTQAQLDAGSGADGN